MKKKIKKFYNSKFEYTKDEQIMNSRRYFVRKVKESKKGLWVEYWHFYKPKWRG